MNDKELFDILNKLNIKYNIVEHEYVYTVEEANNVNIDIDGIGCKNLFLTDHKGKYFLVFLKDEKRANLNELRKLVKTKRLSFASEEELKKVLGLKKGSCTPLGIINDKDNIVTLLIDEDLKDKKIQCHPNRNNATISLEYIDLIKFLEYNMHRYILFRAD